MYVYQLALIVINGITLVDKNIGNSKENQTLNVSYRMYLFLFLYPRLYFRQIGYLSYLSSVSPITNHFLISPRAPLSFLITSIRFFFVLYPLTRHPFTSILLTTSLLFLPQYGQIISTRSLSLRPSLLNFLWNIFAANFIRFCHVIHPP